MFVVEVTEFGEHVTHPALGAKQPFEVEPERLLIISALLPPGKKWPMSNRRQRLTEPFRTSSEIAVAVIRTA